MHNQYILYWDLHLCYHLEYNALRLVDVSRFNLIGRSGYESRREQEKRRGNALKIARM